MTFPPEAEHRLSTDRVVWLTTVTDRGSPVPNPVWFIPDGGDIVVFSSPDSHKVHNIAQRPLVTLHFNSDATGGDVVVIAGTAELTSGQPPSQFPGYLDKYHDDIVGPLDTTVEAIDLEYDTLVRIRPTKIRLTAG